MADLQRCGKWMARAKEHCGRSPLHEGECRTAKALEDHRARKTERRVGQADPAARSRWNLAYKCVHGLLELGCNVSLGHIERKYELARSYLASPPGQHLSGQAA